MPSLGAETEAGTLVKWLVRPGDVVRRGDVVAVVESDKGAIEVEVWEAGVVETLLVEPPAKVPVGTVLARIRRPDEAPGAVPPATAPVAPGTAAPVLPAAAPPPVGAPPEPLRAVPAGGRVAASPAARRRASDLGIDLASVPGTGPQGAVTVEDVERAAAAPATAAGALRERATDIDATRGLRRAIAAAMSRSKREIPHYYLSTRIDMSRATAWLAARNLERPVGERLLPVVLLVKAVALSVADVPETNGFFEGGAFRPSERVHVGVAVALRGGGLVAPAVHDADRKSVSDLMRDLDSLVSRARAGTLRASELSEPTITVTSLGEQGVDSVAGVIQPPQVALVGFGRITERPWAESGVVSARPAVVATLSADHRASDGRRGAHFLAAIDRRLQTPEAL
jgi:pyruvate dehydrogenase E2 component (dihydrolipoamide acetyltransferase)